MRTLPLPNFGEKSFFFSKSALNTCVLHLTLISQFFVKSKLMTFPISHLNLDELLCSIIFDQILVKLWIKSPIFDYIILWRKPYYFGCFWGINNNCLDVKSGHPKAPGQNMPQWCFFNFKQKFCLRIGDDQITSKSTMNILGILFDTKLQWYDQVAQSLREALRPFRSLTG